MPAETVCPVPMEPSAYVAIALLLCVLLYINAQSVVNDTPVHVIFADGVAHAVVPEIATVHVNVAPPAVYPADETSFVAEYAVVAAPIEPAVVYNAHLKASAAVLPRATLVSNA